MVIITTVMSETERTTVYDRNNPFTQGKKHTDTWFLFSVRMCTIDIRSHVNRLCDRCLLARLWSAATKAQHPGEYVAFAPRQTRCYVVCLSGTRTSFSPCSSASDQCCPWATQQRWETSETSYSSETSLISSMCLIQNVIDLDAFKTRFNVFWM